MARQDLCHGASILHVAASGNNQDIVKLLLNNKNIDVNQSNNNNGFTPLIYACQDGYKEITESLLGREDIDVNQSNKNGDTPLIMACYNGHKEITGLLLGRKNTKVNRPDNNGFTPLITACQKGHEEITGLLLDRKDIKVNQPNKDGATPLIYACQNGHKKITGLLLDRKDIKVNQSNNNGDTPLIMACYNDYKKITGLLLDHEDIKVNQSNNNGNTPLIMACYNGHKKITGLLLGHKDINVNQCYGKNTALYFACANRSNDYVQIEIVGLLLEKGAQITSVDLLSLKSRGVAIINTALLGQQGIKPREVDEDIIQLTNNIRRALKKEKPLNISNLNLAGLDLSSLYEITSNFTEIKYNDSTIIDQTTIDLFTKHSNKSDTSPDNHELLQEFTRICNLNKESLNDKPATSCSPEGPYNPVLKNPQEDCLRKMGI